MATTNPTPNYDWVLPIPGGSIGAWGTILNKIIADDGTPLGIDGVLAALREGVDDIEADISALDARVETIETAGASAYYARLYRSSTQNIPAATTAQVEFDAESFDQGDVVDGSNFKIPEGAGGGWTFKAQVRVPFHASFDNSRLWKMQIRRGNEVVSEARSPFMDDGVSSNSGDVTLEASYFDAPNPETGYLGIVPGEIFTVHVYHESAGFGSSAALQGGEAASFFEAFRLVAASATEGL